MKQIFLKFFINFNKNCKLGTTFHRPRLWSQSLKCNVRIVNFELFFRFRVVYSIGSYRNSAYQRVLLVNFLTINLFKIRSSTQNALLILIKNAINFLADFSILKSDFKSVRVEEACSNNGEKSASRRRTAVWRDRIDSYRSKCNCCVLIYKDLSKDSVFSVDFNFSR